MNIMSLDAAYGAGTTQELHQAVDEVDYGHGKGDSHSVQLNQVPQKPAEGFSKLPPPGRHAVASYPPPPPQHAPPRHGQHPPPLQPLPPMPPMHAPPPRPMLPSVPMHPQQQQHQPLRDTQRYAKPSDVAVTEKKSFYDNHKVLIIVMVIVVCLVLGILVAVIVSQKAKKQDLVGGGIAMSDYPHGVPQFVGNDFGGHLSSLPQRAWNESASVYVRR